MKLITITIAGVLMLCLVLFLAGLAIAWNQMVNGIFNDTDTSDSDESLTNAETPFEINALTDVDNN